MSYAKLTREQIAQRIANDIPEGAYVNLGIGMPTLVANHLPKDREIFLHSENGILGMGPAPAAGREDPDLITGAKDAIPAVGGAMDLAVGAKNVWVMMEHLTKSGESKIVGRCTYPLTGIGVVKRIYTDLAVIDVTPRGLAASRLVQGLSFDELQRLSGVPLLPSGDRAAA